LDRRMRTERRASPRKFVLLCLCWLLMASFVLTAAAQAQSTPVTTIKLSFAGDCTLGGDERWMNYSLGTFKAMRAQVDNDAYFFEKCQKIFAQDDLTLVNLEGVLSDSNRGLVKGKKWNFRGLTDSVNILKLGSVEAVTLGNNHSGDYGRFGLDATRQALRDAGIQYCLDEESFIYEKEGVRIAFLGFWETAFRAKRAWLKQEIARLKTEEGCQAVVILYHGGSQYQQKHNKAQTEDAHYAIDIGADLFIGYHPHVLQGIEIYKNRHIIYSLGDFCYGGNRKPRAIEYPGMVTSFELRFEKGEYLGQQLTIHPFRISATAPRNNFQPYPVLGGEADEVMRLLQNDTAHTLAAFVPGLGAQQPFLDADAPQ